MSRLKFRAFANGKMRYDFTGLEHGDENEMGGVFLNGDYQTIGPDCIVMQFTGLQDKNGTDVYEGDLVSFWDDGPGEVVWRDCAFVLKCYDSRDKREWLTMCLPKDMAVIGNVHEQA